MNATPSQLTALDALRLHWPEYLIEAWALGMFMISAGVFTVLFEYPHSTLNSMISDGNVRRVLTGIAMGLTAIALIYSPWGQRSGAHMNPAVTLTFWRRGKVSTWNAVFYVAAQCIGGTLGVYIAIALLGQAFASPQVNYVATIPGSAGVLTAFVAELVISGLLMFMVLRASSSTFAKYTGVFAGILVALFISVEAPLSGMSINPARSLASAIPAHQWNSFWIYIVAPIMGMQLAALIDSATRADSHTSCAKLIHSSSQRCIHCGYQPASSSVIQSSLSGVMS
jgi:aquaporin Z